MPMDFGKMADAYAAKYGIPPGLFRALVKQESGWNPRAGSSAGAQGLTQLMPGTARGLGVRNVWDPAQNLEGGAKYLSQQYNRFKRWDLALSAYNSGPGGAESSGRVEGFAETQKYVRNILGSVGASGKAPVVQGATVLQNPQTTFSRENAVRNAKQAFAGGLMQAMQQTGKSRTDAMLTQALGLRRSMREINEMQLKMGQTTSAPTVLNLRPQGVGSPGTLDQLLKGMGQTITSGYRPGAVTKRGTRSFHADDRARDIDHRDPDFPKLVNFARSNPGYFTEFFYDPLKWYIKNGKIVQGSIGGHSDHAHAAR